MVRIILKCGYEINVLNDKSVKEIRDSILAGSDFVGIGESFIRAEDISAVLVPYKNSNGRLNHEGI